MLFKKILKNGRKYKMVYRENFSFMEILIYEKSYKKIDNKIKQKQ